MIRRFLERRRARIAAALLPVKRAMLGDEIMVGVDVGSAGGMQPHWRAYEGVLDFYCFEPHEASFRRLTEAYAKHPEREVIRVLPVGLSGGGGERTLYMLNTPTGSSLYPVNTESEFVDAGDRYIYPVRETVIGTRKLEEVLDEQRVEGVDIIKLDVQGAELEILQGLGRCPTQAPSARGIGDQYQRRGNPEFQHLSRRSQLAGLRTAARGRRHAPARHRHSVARSYRANKGDDDWYQREVFDVYRNTPTLAAHAWETDAVYVRDWRARTRDRNAAGIRQARRGAVRLPLLQRGEDHGAKRRGGR